MTGEAAVRDALVRLGDRAAAEYEAAKDGLRRRVATDGSWQARTAAEVFIAAAEQLMEARAKDAELDQPALASEACAWKARAIELERLIGETRGTLGSMILTCEGSPMEEDRPHMAKLARELADKFKAALRPTALAERA